MKYALLVYGPASWDGLPSEDKRALHRAQRDLHDEYQTASTASARVIAHYRVRPPQHTTTVRLAGSEIVRSQGPSAEATEALRALYILESDAADAVLDFATRLPAVHTGADAEVWPLTEPDPHAQERRGYRNPGRAALTTPNRG